ncbi:M3 family metallopeptidase [Legionella sp. W05-934-2]|jgi:oligopeptidase A|uniref:M3 family metallopeptidase n=1 Tax=Legionella sp. W05-934-2 TaxID=1198649 RepID=UPI0034619F37
MPLPKLDNLDTKEFVNQLSLLLQSNLDQINDIIREHHHYTWDNLMQPLEWMENNVEKHWAPIAQLNAVVNSDDLRVCYQKSLAKLTAYEATVGQNEDLYNAICSIDIGKLSHTQKKIIHDSLRSFKLSGVALDSANKKRFEEIQTRLSELSNQFENNVLDATQDYYYHVERKDELKGMPAHAIEAAQQLASSRGETGYMLSLEFPCFYAVITYAEDRILRENIYHAYMTRASDIGPSAGKFDNGPIIYEIMALRQELAKLLGFETYADYSLADKMAKNRQEVMDFLTDLNSRAYHQARVEFKQLESFAQQNLGFEHINPWDIAYISEKKRQHRYHLSQEDLRPYFPLSKVLEGMFEIIKRLYGIQINKMEPPSVWHNDVNCYQMVDDKGNLRGIVYMDLFARSNKRGGAWMATLQSRCLLPDGSIQYPIATVNCNFAKTDKKESCLSHDEVLTLFHEFGHCLHHVLTKVDYYSASGINGVEWDAVELPSQFFENWCWQQSALDLISKHVTKGETLPVTMFDQLWATKNFQSAMAMVRQLEFSLFDFRLHSEFDPKNGPGQIEGILSDVRESTSVVPIADYNRFVNSFSHIFGGGYSAGYYSYKWAEVLSSDAFSRFEEDGIFNSHSGRDFLHFILETGSSQTAKEAYLSFRGRMATVDALLKHSGIR